MDKYEVQKLHYNYSAIKVIRELYKEARNVL